MIREADSYRYYFPTDEMISNPHIGFQTFQRFNGDALFPKETRRWSEGYPIEYQEDKGVRENIEFPFTTVAYTRVNWRYFEPEEGAYNWELFDKALAAAEAHGQTLMVRLPPYGMYVPGRDYTKDDLPDWLRAKLGPVLPLPKGGETDRFQWKMCVMDAANDLYPYAYARAVRAFAAHYDGDPRLDSIDIGIMGPWGEDAGIERMPLAHRSHILDAYLEGFVHTPMMAQCNSLDMVKEIMRKRPAGVGLRGDCLGNMTRHDPLDGWNWSHMSNYYPFLWGREGVRDLWKTGPISFEVCGVMHTWIDWGCDIDYIIQQSLKWHISTFNAKSSPVPRQWAGKVDEWIKRMGYRYALRTACYPAAAAPGDTAQLRLWFENNGVAPIYRKYPFVLRLAGERGRFDFDTDIDIRSFLPGDSIAEIPLRLPETLPEGEYDLRYAILDPRTRKPKVRFACDTPRDEDGYDTFARIKIAK